jgi:integrase/recombinase XerD
MGTKSVVLTLGHDQLRATGLHDSADAFAEHLARRHLGRISVETYLRVAAHFGRWLDGGGGAASAQSVDAFLSKHLPRCCCRGAVTRSRIIVRAALGHLVSVLRSTGRFEEPPALCTPVGVEIDAFDAYMVRVCGLAAATRRRRRYDVHRLLDQVFGVEPVATERLTAVHVREFVASHGKRCSPGTLGVIAGSVRSYLKFLRLEGRCPEGVEAAVPPPPRWRLATVPVHLDDQAVRRLLASFDKFTPRGRRDHAMALCMVVLGLRAAEVAALRLRGVDWRAGALQIPPTKTHRARTLPLPYTVGRAIASYVHHARPASTSDRIFLRIGVREGEAILSTCVHRAMNAAYARAGLSARGSHRLRHTAATRLVRGGASVKEVADLLGHASLDSTGIYAKVDLPRLRRVALPWPGRV